MIWRVPGGNLVVTLRSPRGYLAVTWRLRRRLEQLLTHSDAMVVRYAAGALKNITHALQTMDLSEGATAGPVTAA